MEIQIIAHKPAIEQVNRKDLSFIVDLFYAINADYHYKQGTNDLYH